MGEKVPSRWTLFTYLLFFFSIHLCGILLFTKGFFLTRYEVPNVSKCEAAPSPHQDTILPVKKRIQTHDCWAERKYDKGIILIIDALRFDYVVFNESANSAYHVNKLPIIHHLHKDQPKNTLIYRFRADPPTTTMQRLKGLTTGAIPTFIEVVLNFDSSAIEEDNIISQLIQNGRRITFMGDDTWENLFPGKMHKSWPFPSFNVKDLHTVDNGVLSHLTPEMKLKDWNVLIGHFLGVDHVGHRYEINHPEMEAKLGQMNKMIEEVVSMMDDKTLLVVLGDHGSTMDGNHGGGTEEELNAALFLYSRKPFLSRPLSPSSFPSVSQVDLVPTLSLLLGVPIPYGNIGGVIPEIFLGTSQDQASAQQFAKANEALHLNAWQMFDYLQTYTSVAPNFPSSTLSHLWDSFKETNQLFHIHKNSKDREMQQTIYEGYRGVLRGTAQVCRELWVSFDLVNMREGVLLLLLSLILLILQLVTPAARFPFVSVSMGVLMGLIVTPGVLYLLGDSWAPFSVPTLLLGYSLGGSVGFLSSLLRRWRRWNFKTVEGWVTWEGGVGILFLVLHLFSLFSNSFIEAEGHVIHFFCFSLVTLFFVRAFQLSPNVSHISFTFILPMGLSIALSKWTTGGVYEEVGTSFLWFLFESILPLLLIPVGTSQLVESLSDNFPKNFRRWSFSLYFLIGLFWTFQRLGVFQEISSLQWMEVGVPWMVYLGTLGALMDVSRSIIPSPFLSEVVASLTAVLCLVSIPLLLLEGLKSSPTFLLLFIQLFSFLRLLKKLQKSPREELPQGVMVFWAFFAIQYFFSTGHSFNFNSLHWAAGFIGFEDMHMVGSGLLVAMDTSASLILFTLAVPLVVAWLNPPDRDSLPFQKFFHPFFAYMLYFHVSAVGTMIFVYLQRRHLMVWRVFAPKYLFDVGYLLAVDLFLLLATFILLRVHVPSIKFALA